MGIIHFLGWTDAWNTNLNEPLSKSLLSNNLVFVIMFVFSSIYLGMALMSMLAVSLVILLIQHFYSIVIPEFGWMFYGLLFGLFFSFFLQAIPRQAGEDETPAKIFQSFKHHLTYALAFFTVVMIWVCIFLIVTVFFNPF